MSNDNYPGLYRYADSASTKAQQIYLLLSRLHLGSLMLASVVGSTTSLEGSAWNTGLFTTISIILAMGFLVLWIMRSRQDDKIWFDARAVAESVKTATWRFMMKTPPFQEDDGADELFISHLREIREARPHLQKHIAAVCDANGLAITDFMRDRRAYNLEDRKAFYISDRLSDEKSWYAKKARLNATLSNAWFWIVAGLQVLAVVIAIIQAVFNGLGINIIPVLMTCVAAFAAWGQIKRHDELAQSYTLAVQELGELESLSDGQATVEDVTQLVEQAENSISREHTMWCARRDVRLTGSRTH